LTKLGEPESYIIDRPHDTALASALPPLSELVLPSVGRARIERVGRVRTIYLTVPGSGVPGIFRAEGAGVRFVTDDLRAWLSSHEAGRWLAFEEVVVTRED
jgi:hypothetical protein